MSGRLSPADPPVAANGSSRGRSGWGLLVAVCAVAGPGQALVTAQQSLSCCRELHYLHEASILKIDAMRLQVRVDQPTAGAVYIRKKPKGFGRNAQIEGDIREAARTLLVEDLTTDGRSKINFCKALRDAGAVIEHVYVNFYYDIFPESKKVMGDLGVRLHHIASWWDVLKVVNQGNYLPAAQIGEVETFLHGPAAWSAAHGGVSSFPSS